MPSLKTVKITEKGYMHQYGKQSIHLSLLFFQGQLESGMAQNTRPFLLKNTRRKTLCAFVKDQVYSLRLITVIFRQYK